MKKMKSLILKGMLVSMAAVAGMAAVVPHGAQNCDVLAAENSVGQTTEFYQHLTEKEANERLESAMRAGTVIATYDNTVVIKIDGATYVYSTYKPAMERQYCPDIFETEQEAYRYAEKQGWKNIYVYENPYNTIKWDTTYLVEGDLQFVNLRIIKS